MQADPKSFNKENLFKYFRIALFAFVGIYICLLIASIAYYAVDIPYWDEWELLGNGWLIDGPIGKWIINHHNEHRVIPTHLLYLFNYFVFGLNFKAALIMNIPIYGLLVYSIVKLSLHTLGSNKQKPFGYAISNSSQIVLLLGTFPLLSNIIQFNHMMSGQNCIHFCFLGLFSGLLFVDRSYRSINGRPLVWTAILWIMSIYSFAGGIPAVWSTFIYLTIIRYRSKSLDRSWFWLGISLLVATIIWFIDYPSQSTQTDNAATGLSALLLFGRYWIELLSLGFGYMNPTLVPSLLCFVLVSGIAIGSFYSDFKSAKIAGLNLKGKKTSGVINYNNEKTTQNSESGSRTNLVSSAYFGMLTVLSVMTFGRFQMGFEQAKSARYAEVSAIIPVLTVVLILRISNKKLKAFSLLLTFCLLSAGLRDDFGVRGYSAVYARRMREVHCVKRLIENPSLIQSESCPGIYPGSLATFLENGRKLKIHFFTY